MKQTIMLEPEDLLLSYFETLLKNGVTCGITKDMYFDLVAELTKKVNCDSNGLSLSYPNISAQVGDFESIVERADKKINKIPGTKTIYMKEDNGTLAAYPTNKLILDNFSNKLTYYPRIERMLKEVLKTKIPNIPLKDSVLNCAVPEILNNSKKVAAFFVNDFIERYVKCSIKKGKWPEQCRDIDEYVFRRNIAQYIDMEGTAEFFKILYIHAINVVYELLEKKGEAEEIEFSNNEFYTLAHANFLKFIMPEKLQFLRAYKHDQYEENDASIKVSIIENEVKFVTNTCVYFDPYGNFSDDYVRYVGNIGSRYVEIMEKRIGKID